MMKNLDNNMPEFAGDRFPKLGSVFSHLDGNAPVYVRRVFDYNYFNQSTRQKRFLVIKLFLILWAWANKVDWDWIQS
jgi:hypothetical protein